MPTFFYFVILHLYSLQPFRRFLRLTFPLCNWKSNTETQNCSEKRIKQQLLAIFSQKSKREFFDTLQMTNNLTLIITISETASVTISVTISMPREEISVLSSARREEIRRQLDEAERYRANPVLYIFNPHIRVSIMIMLLLKMIMMINTAVADILQITTQHPVIIETTAVGFLCLPSNIFFQSIFHPDSFPCI